MTHACAPITRSRLYLVRMHMCVVLFLGGCSDVYVFDWTNVGFLCASAVCHYVLKAVKNVLLMPVIPPAGHGPLSDSDAPCLTLKPRRPAPVSERETGTEIEKDPSCPAYQTSGPWLHVSHVTRHRLHITYGPRDLKVKQVNALVKNVLGSISFKEIRNGLTSVKI